MAAPSCPSCRSPLAPVAAPGGTALRCPRCYTAASTAVGADAGATVTGTYRPDPAETVARKGPADAPDATADVQFLAPPQRPDEIGRVGPYRVLGRIGAGGMGVVFRAEDTVLQRFVALKVMLPQFTADPTWKARFVREARAQARVEHENVVAIFDVGEHGTVTYLAMPLLKGQSLSAALKQNRLPPLREALRIARETAQGLAAAHAVGLIHRDIKPGNIWLEGTKRRIKILDFGLARAAGTDAADTATGPRTEPLDGTLTVQGAIVGTPAFMSPEQAKGEKVDHRTDLYSLGVMLYQMTAGRLPYAGSTALAILIAAETERLAPPNAINPNVPAPVADLVMRLLARSAARRPQSAEAVVEELRRLEELVRESVNLSGPPPAPVPNDPWADIDSDSPSEPGTSVMRPARRGEPAQAARWPLVAGGALALLVVAVIGVLAAWPVKRPPTEPTPEPEPLVQKAIAPPKVPAPKDKEPVPKPKDVPPALPELAGLRPSLRFDYTASPPADAPGTYTDPQGRYTRTQTATALAYRSPSGTWWATAGPCPRDMAVEVRARVTSPTGAWIVNLLGHSSPVIDKSLAGVTVAVDHLGALAVAEYNTGKTPDEFPPRTFSPRGIKTGREWNTVLAVIRNDKLDVYANGELVVSGIAVWHVPGKRIAFGVRTLGAPAEVEFERVVMWDAAGLPKK